MKITLILLFLVEVAISKINSNNDTKKKLIFNGEVYNRDEYPFVVYYSIQEDEGYITSCTGSLLRPLYVLSAAHCVFQKKKEDIKVYNGPVIDNPVWRTCVQLHVHKGYKHKATVTQSDLCMLKLNATFPNSKTIAIGDKISIFDKLKEVKCTFIGFGMVDNNEDSNEGDKGFIYTGFARHGKKACKKWDGDLIKNTWKQYLCAVPGKSMVCKGDSGGPMICNNKLYGVGSFIFNYTGRPIECGGPTMQTVHVLVRYFKPWINNILSNKNAGKSIVSHHSLIVVFAVLWYQVWPFY